jgi:diguanylate cyclase (GGDEF)-like protein
MKKQTKAQETLRVLLVEDDVDQAVLAQAFLKKDIIFNYDVAHVETLKATEKALSRSSSSFQLVLLDLNLPDSRGNVTLAKVKSLSSDMPIVVLTGIDNTEQEYDALELGAEEYLVKGEYIAKDLIRSIHHAYNRHKRVLSLEQERNDLRDIVDNIKQGDVDAILDSSSSSHVIPLLDDSVVNDLLKQVKTQHVKLKRLAMRDTLTQLYNRIEFESRSEEVLSLAKRQENNFAVFFIDVDNFKTINDTHGHEVGDSVLQMVSKKWQACLREGDILGRLGGDEFGLILPMIEKPEDAGAIADKLISSLEGSLFIDDKPIEVTVSIGIACYPQASDNAKTLLKYADIAMYRAKSSMGNQIEYYTRRLQKEHFHQHQVLTLLRTALHKKEFHLVYQPILDIQTNQMTGMEALLRWDNAEIDNVGPEEFIPLAEEHGLIIPIGQWVIEQAFFQYQAWSNKFEKKMSDININLSIKQLLAKNLVGTVQALVKRHHIDPSRVLFELTETAIMTDIDASRKVLDQFSQLGARFSIDDFGTGYSSMLHLKLLPLSEIKIDRSFVRDIMSDPNDAAIVKSMISLAKSLGLEVVAEGIETKEQLDFLIEHGCDKGQGYYFSRPLSVDAMTDYLKQQKG